MSPKRPKSPVPFPRMVKPPVLPRDDSKSHMLGIPSGHDALIGRVIWRWSYIEIIAEELIWRFLHVNVDVGRKITSRLDFRFKSRLLKELAADTFRDEKLRTLLSLIGRIDDLYDVRNMIAHGQWVTIQPGDIPAVQSLRESLPTFAGRDEIVLTECTADFMLKIVEHILKCASLLVSYRDEISPSQNISG